jgi:hypothetical protein
MVENGEILNEESQNKLTHQRRGETNVEILTKS